MLVLEQVRCPMCNRLLGNIKGQAQIKCSKCKSLIYIDTDMRKVYIAETRKR